jgi:Kef-type K+ transport system membrane component KefB
MEYGLEIVADIAIIMAIAGGIIFLFAKLKQPVILGYLIAESSSDHIPRHSS